MAQQFKFAGYALEVDMPSSGYAHNHPYLVGPFPTEQAAINYGTKFLDEDSKVQGWEVLILNDPATEKGDWVS